MGLASYVARLFRCNFRRGGERLQLGDERVGPGAQVARCSAPMPFCAAFDASLRPRARSGFGPS
jgi:hypothetical protein